MPGYILDPSATVICAHGGQATPTVTNPRVTVGGQPVTTMSAPYSIAGCAFVPPAGTGPCTTAQWMVGATRVTAGGDPVLIQSSSSTCIPTGTPLTIVVTQVRVQAT
ncbi:MAG TPA: hypothetical protein VN906_09215 [Candidatus Sulfotelmatobacter sp.]|nr:hypothetical protein [Candidatus Sulfotelmatobacter sp.]